MSFTDIEGNLAPEDCFLSRQIISHAHDDPATFLAEFTERAGNSPFASSTLYAASLPYKVAADVVRPIFESMVGLSDHGNRLERFLALPMPRMVMYGQEQQPLLPPTTRRQRYRARRNPAQRPLPMYSNPPAMLQRIGQFITHHEGASRGNRSFHLEAPRRIVSLGACLVPSRPGALRDAEDSASRRPRPEYAGKGAVPTLRY